MTTTNPKATIRSTLSYADAHGVSQTADAVSIQSAYQGQSHGGIDVPDTTPTATEYDVDFGSIAAATAVMIENKLAAQDLKVRVNDLPQATGTLVSGALDIALANVSGDRLEVQLVTAHGTPGVLSVKRKDDSTVTVQSWLASTGIQTADVSDVKVYNHKDGYAFGLPAGGLLVIAGAALSANPVVGVKVKTTGTQAGAGTVATDVFGDPAS